MCKLLTVIVNYRTPQLTVDCLHSLASELPELDGRVIITDNLSGDDSVERLQAAVADNHWQNWATVLPLDKNGGFAFGNNAALRVAFAETEQPEFVLLLNPDTIARPAAVRALVDFAHAHPKAGIIGSRLEDPDGTPQRSAFRYPTWIGEFEGAVRFGVISKILSRWSLAPPVSDAPCQAEWLAGASLLVRREVFDAIGLLDEGYFMYYEETDFCRRATDAGFECWYAPESRVVHLVGQASGVTDVKRKLNRRPRYWFDSRRRYLRAHHGAVGARAIDLAWIVGHAGWWTRATVMRKPKNDPARIWLDFIGQSTLFKGRPA